MTSKCSVCGRGYCRKRYTGGCGGKDFLVLTPAQVKQRILQTDRRTKKIEK